MSTVIKYQSDLPSWFEIYSKQEFSNYVDSPKFIDELKFRAHLYHSIVNGSEIDRHRTDRRAANEILIHRSQGNYWYIDMFAELKFDGVEAALENICNFDTLGLLQIGDVLKLNKIIQNAGTPDLNNKHFAVHDNLCINSIDERSKSRFFIEFELKDKSDEMLMLEFSILLRRLRKYTKINSSTKPNLRQDDFLKLLNYRVFEVFDLLYWAALNEKKIKYSLLATVVFPDGSRGENDIKQTIIPFLRKVFSFDYLQTISTLKSN